MTEKNDNCNSGDGPGAGTFINKENRQGYSCYGYEEFEAGGANNVDVFKGVIEQEKGGGRWRKNRGRR